MTPLQEKKYLLAVLKQIDHGAPKAYLNFWVDLAMWISAAVIFLAIFQLGDKLHPLVSLFVTLLVGIAAGAFAFCQLAAKQWPFLRSHITRESIVGRLAELEP